MSEPTHGRASLDDERAATPAPPAPNPRHAKTGRYLEFPGDVIDPVAEMRVALELYDDEAPPSAPPPRTTIRARLVALLRRRPQND